MPSTSSAKAAAGAWPSSTTPWLGSLPLTLAIREQTDAGQPTVVSDPGSEAAALYRGIARKLAASVAALPRDMAGKFPSIVVQQPT